MDNKKNGIPKLRFPGFTGAWEQRKLGEIGKVFTGNTPSTKNTENWTTDKSIGHVWITPTDINNNIMFDSERYLSDKGWSQARVVPKNSVLITSIASIGKNAINGVEVAFNQQINALVVQKNNPYFILTLMNKEKQRFESLAGQTATPIINKSTFSSFMVKIPSETEQEQIGEFFKQLDSLIALHQRKLEHLQEQKKGLLQKMFPKNGETVPEVRFPGFTDAWEQRKFFDNIEKVIDFRGRTPKKLGMKWSNEGYVALSALNVKDGYIDFTADVHYANKALYDKWMVGNDLYKGQVLFTTEAPMGNVAQIPDNQKYVLSQRTIAFDVFRNKITNDFLAVLLRSQNVQHKLKSLASGGTAQGVSQKSLSQLKVTVPTRINEQQKIGEFFKQLDSLIALHQRKLDHLELMKKGLLQQMFV